MTIELITGHAGSEHVSAADAGWLNAGAFGSGKYVLDTGTQLACTVQSANLVTIGTGDAVFEGRHVRVSAPENVAIDNGAQGVNRNDIVCIKYIYTSGTGVETASLSVVKGTATSGTATDPTIPSGSILDGSTTAYMPLWRIPLSGINAGTPVKLFGDVIVPLNGLLSKVWTLSQIPDLPASKVTSGTFPQERIPDLSAAKIAYGTFTEDLIPYLSATHINRGAFDVARIPSLPASKIGSGTLPVSRGGTGKDYGTIYTGETLYNNSSGTTGTVTLAYSASYYSIMDIFFCDNDNHYSSTRVFSPNGKTVNLSMATNKTNGQNNYKRREVTISSTSITNQSYGEQDGTAAASSTNNIYIYAVIGYA